MERAPSRAETAAFLARFAAALEDPEVAVEAFGDQQAPGAVGFGVDFAALREVAWRRALPPGSAVQLEEVARWRIPPEVDRLTAAVLDPSQRLRQLRQHVVQAAAVVARAKSEAWNAGQARDLYPVLNQALAELGLGAGLAEALLALEERAAPRLDGEVDVVVACPVDGVGVSLRLSCARCRWRGPAVGSCLLPAARAFAVAADEVGRGMELAEGLRRRLGS